MDEKSSDDYIRVEFNSYAQMLHCSADLFNLEHITDITPVGDAAFLLPYHLASNKHVSAIIEGCQKNDFYENIEEAASHSRSDAFIRREDLSPG